MFKANVSRGTLLNVNKIFLLFLSVDNFGDKFKNSYVSRETFFLINLNFFVSRETFDSVYNAVNN